MADDAIPTLHTPPLPLLTVGGAGYLTGEEWLKVTAYNTATAITLTITGRVLPFGERRPIPFRDTLTPTTDGLASTKAIALPDGWLLNVDVRVTAGTPSSQSTYVVLALQRGYSANAEEVATLAADYASTFTRVTYPGSGVHSVASFGVTSARLRSIVGTTPAPGSEITETVPAGVRWQLLSFFMSLLTSAAAANRIPYLYADDGVHELWTAGGDVQIAANSGLYMTFAPGLIGLTTLANTAFGRPIPNPTILGPGYRLKTSTIAIQAGDQYGAVQYLVNEWTDLS